jgi:hypothetical protein
MIELQSWTYITNFFKYRENETQSKLHGLGSNEESNLIYFANGIIWKVERFIVINCFFLFKRYNNYVPCELLKQRIM